MNLSIRIFLALFLAIVIVFYLFYDTAVEQIDLSINQATEETLVDVSNLLAELLKDDFQKNRMAGADVLKAFEDYAQRKIDADIFDNIKKAGALRVYVTDSKGVVIFDSKGKDLGRDFSKWNDVYLTLRGEYGARATRLDSKMENTSILYVAAPINDGEEIIGVLTVAKSKASLLPYRERVMQSILDYSFLFGVFLLISVVFVALWIRRSTNRLVEYAEAVSCGEDKRVTLPRFSESEFDRVSRSMEGMRNQLEGKAYIENYVQSLTHEIKSPIASISGALNLLGEDIKESQPRYLLENMDSEVVRLQTIVAKMLELASLEHKQALDITESLKVKELIEKQLSINQLVLDEKAIKVRKNLDEKEIMGDSFLLSQLVANLLDNAIRFSPRNADLVITYVDRLLVIQDAGPGIPDYAIKQVFDRFYSLPDTQTGRKSTGLGLSFVRQIVDLHGADISLSNCIPGLRVAVNFSLHTKHT